MDAPEPTDDTDAGVGGQPDAEGTFELTREELRTTFEYQVQRLREIDAKAIEILKANLLLIGIVVTAASILVQTEFVVSPFVNAFALVGVFLLLLSTALAGVTYTSSNLRGGLDPDAVESAIAARRAEEVAAFEERLLRSYARWIDYNARMTAINDMLATVTVLLVILAFVYVGIGIGVAVFRPPLAVEAVLFVVVTVALAWLGRLVYRMDHLGPAPPEWEDTFDGVRLSKGVSRKEGSVALREMLRRPGDGEE